MVQLKGEPTVDVQEFDQCVVGAPTKKPTALLGNLPTSLAGQRCGHTARSWTVPWSGETSWGPHPMLAGKQLAIPSEQWSPAMLGGLPGRPIHLARGSSLPRPHEPGH